VVRDLQVYWIKAYYLVSAKWAHTERKKGAGGVLTRTVLMSNAGQLRVDVLFLRLGGMLIIGVMYYTPQGQS
jgi:hypothetical protein